MRLIARKFLITVALVLLAAVIVAGFSVSFTVYADSYATLQGTYGDTDAASLWYYGENALDIAGAKVEIDKWDKSGLDSNDPVIVAVLDSGLDVEHELYNDMLLRDSGGNVMCYDAYKDELNGKMNDNADGSHGNAVTGIIAMALKELGLSEYVKVYPIKVTNDNGGIGLESVVRALDQATEIGADIINMSFGILKSQMQRGRDWTTDPSLRYAINIASENAFIVAAAGNDNADGSDPKNLFYPAAFDGVFSVVNYYELTDGSLAIAPNSNYGAYDIAAPGEGIYTAKEYILGSGYQKNFGGTSASAAFASAAGALLELRFRAEGEGDPDGINMTMMMSNLAGLTGVTKGLYTYGCLNYRTIVTQNFSQTEYEYTMPNAIELSHDGKLGDEEGFKDTIVMAANEVVPVNFIAKVLPYGRTDPLWNGRVEWSLVDLNGTEIRLGQGAKFTYNATKFGDTKLIARLRIGETTIEASQRIYIKFLQYYVGNFKVTYASMADETDIRNVATTGVLYTTETVEFGVTSLRFLDDSVPVKWFVNGKYVASGVKYKFRPTLPGTYRISVQYGDNARVDYDGYAFVATVKSFIARPINLAVFIILLALVLGVISVAVALVILHKKQKQAVDANKSDDQLPV